MEGTDISRCRGWANFVVCIPILGTSILGSETKMKNQPTNESQEAEIKISSFNPIL